MTDKMKLSEEIKNLSEEEMEQIKIKIEEVLRKTNT